VHCTVFTGVGRDVNVSFFRNSIHNLATAIETRVFRRKIGSDWEFISSTPHSIDQYSKFLHSPDGIFNFEKSFDDHVSTIAPLTDDQFVQHYLGRRRRVYQNALDSLNVIPLAKEDANCKCFLKKEKDIPADKPDAIPRVITFPDPRYGLSFGRYIKAIEHDFFICIDSIYRSKTVMKGLNYLQVGEEIERKWNRFQNPRSIDGDVSRLDSSISDTAQRLYHKFASKFFHQHDRSTFERLCEMQLNVKVRGRADDGHVKFNSSGLGSGQMNTSQMGVFVVCYILYALIRHLDIDVELVNSGDDFTIIGERKDVEIFQDKSQSWFKDFNMVLKLDPIQDTIERIVFCQTQPVLVNGKYRMVRNPMTAPVKDASSIDNLKSITSQSKFLRAISSSGIATHGGIPVFQDIYQMFARSSNAMLSNISNKRGRKRALNAVLEDHSMKYWGKNLSLCYQDTINDETRYSFFLAFDIDPVEQKHMEKYYSQYVIDNTIFEENFGDIFGY